jgi:hypothetical protein
MLLQSAPNPFWSVLLVCVCRYEAGPLERRQHKVFDPLLVKARQELGWQLQTSSSIFGTTQPDATVAAVQQYLQGVCARVCDVGRRQPAQQPLMLCYVRGDAPQRALHTCCVQKPVCAEALCVCVSRPV